MQGVECTMSKQSFVDGVPKLGLGHEGNCRRHMECACYHEVCGHEITTRSVVQLSVVQLSLPTQVSTLDDALEVGRFKDFHVDASGIRDYEILFGAPRTDFDRFFDGVKDLLALEVHGNLFPVVAGNCHIIFPWH